MTAWLRRMPLQVKLVAAVLVLVTAALLVIGVASAVALRSYLVNEIDSQLSDTLQREQLVGLPSESRSTVLPTDLMLQWRFQGLELTLHDQQRYEPEDLPPTPATVAEAEQVAGEAHTVVAENGDLRWRMLVNVLPSGVVLTAAQDMSGVNSAMGRLIRIEVLVGAAVLLLAGGLGIASVRISLRPLVKIERTAEAIAGGDLTRRVPDPDAATNTEVGRLATALNTMLAQIEAAFTARAASEKRARDSEERMRQFVADASHELRTPLTTIRGFAELYRQGAARDPEQTRELLGRIESEAARMGLLVEDLLLLARLDQERPVQFAPVALPTLVTEAVDGARAVDPERPITLDGPADDSRMVVAGDEARLRQVISNLLDNALTHTSPATPVTVRLRTEGGSAVIEVTDEGPGLTEEQVARVFERFYRVDTARGRRAPGRTESAGTGLGLAIIAALVAAHRGTVDVDTAPGRGATFRVRIPLADEGVQAIHSRQSGTVKTDLGGSRYE